MAVYLKASVIKWILWGLSLTPHMCYLAFEKQKKQPWSLHLMQLIKRRQDFVSTPEPSYNSLCDWRTLIFKDAGTQGKDSSKGLAKFSQYITNRFYHLY